MAIRRDVYEDAGRFDEDFFATMKLPERVFVTAHEISHAMWQHMARAKGYLDAGFDGKPFDLGLPAGQLAVDVGADF